MMRGLVAIVILALMSPVRAAEVVDLFDAAELDTATWNTCQARDDQLKLADVDDNGVARHALLDTVDATTGNTDVCASAPPAVALMDSPSAAVSDFFASDEGQGRDLGPSFIPLPEEAPPRGEPCPTGAEFQRNELRFSSAESIHDWSVPHWYSVTFHVAGDIFPCGSARWVIGQWKQPAGESPVLAQRLDNGVLHVTVQNGDCRCMIAKASGDPDATTFAAFRALGFITGSELSEVAPLRCINSTTPAHAPEKTCEPAGLSVLTEGGQAPPELPDPRAGWVTMTYHVKAGKQGQIDVYANGRFIVRARGKIGYADDPGPVKFKIGQYRDAVPGSVVLGVDRLCLSETAKVCDPKVRPVQ